MEKIKISKCEDFETKNGKVCERGYKLYFSEYSINTKKIFVELDDYSTIEITIFRESNLKEIVNMLNGLGFNYEYKESVK